MAKVRLFRFMIYEYDSWEQSDEDTARWAVPPLGTKIFGTQVVRSAIIITPPDIDEVEPDES